MKSNVQNPLRDQAEIWLGKKLSIKKPALSAEQLLHELQVHQIELEMQNEALRQAQIEMEESRDHFVEFYDFAPVGYITLDEKGVITEINLTGAAMLGVERSKLVHRHFSPIVTAEHRDHWGRYFLDVIKREDQCSIELTLQRSDGKQFYSQMDCLRIAKEGKAPELRIVLIDITRRKQAEEIVREQEEFFRMIAESTQDFIAVIDLEGNRLYNSPSYARLFGETGQLKGTDSFAEIHPDDREHIKRIFKETVQSGIGLQAEFRFVLADGSIRHMESRGGLINNSRGQPQRVVVVSRDITERKAAEEQTSFLAFHDALTNLPNRRLLNDRLEKAIAASKRSGHCGAVIFLDLDNFKPINDTHGHKAGDLLLVEVARRLEGCVREVDTVARFGGDEFAVVLSELGEGESECEKQAGLVAEKILAALAKPYWLAYNNRGTAKMIIHHHCGASIGVAPFNSHESAEDILKWADNAMYQAKEAGRNAIRFHGQS